jgi:NAD(P)-dependent dehydrogenase (short-subunit alcohol dehydrogenase family)
MDLQWAFSLKLCERTMPIQPTVFSQLAHFLPLHSFRQCVERYNGNHKVQRFTCMDQFLCMAFAQLTYRESLRDIETCLRTMQPKLYHMGIRGRVARSTLADANESRDWRIYADFAQALIAQARTLYQNESLAVDLEAAAYALDATTIDLCLALFPWAHFHKTKAAVKLHTLLNLRGNIPEFVCISEGNVHDVNVLDVLVAMAGAFYIMDRGYVDFARLHRLHVAGAFFVTRAKQRMLYKRQCSRPVDKASGLRSDQTILLAGKKTAASYPAPLRRIHYKDPETGKDFVFLCNNFTLGALDVARLYKARWQVELFFKWIKQHLRIKAFYGTSENAVKTQVWIAVSIYVLVAIVKKRLHLDHSLYTILQIFSITLFEKKPILQVFSENECTINETDDEKQLLLLGF